MQVDFKYTLTRLQQGPQRPFLRPGVPPRLPELKTVCEAILPTNPARRAQPSRITDIEDKVLQ